MTNIFPITYLLKRRNKKNSKSFVLRNITCSVNSDKREFSIRQEERLVKIGEDDFANFLYCFSHLVFRTYCYSPSVCLWLQQYTDLTTYNDIKNPTSATALNTFSKIHESNNLTVDFHYLFSLVTRHAALLTFAKIFQGMHNANNRTYLTDSDDDDKDDENTENP